MARHSPIIYKKNIFDTSNERSLRFSSIKKTTLICQMTILNEICYKLI